MRWSKEHYMKRYPQYNRLCVECGAEFNALHLGSSRRITCSKECSEAHTKRLQRENTRAYIKSDKYKAYKAQYYEAVKARRRLIRIGDALAPNSNQKLAPA
jgi:hypothetical protein